jgi:hypothetical protein
MRSAVVVSGASIGGLSTALTLAKRGIPVTVTAFSESAHVEEACIVGSTGVRALEWLDVDVKSLGGVKLTQIVEHRGTTHIDVIECKGVAGLSRTPLALPKTALLNALEKALDHRGGFHPVLHKTKALYSGTHVKFVGREMRQATTPAFLQCDPSAAKLSPSGIAKWTCIVPGKVVQMCFFVWLLFTFRSLQSAPKYERFWAVKGARTLSVYPVSSSLICFEAVVPHSPTQGPQMGLRSAAGMAADLAAFFPAELLQPRKSAKKKRKQILFLKIIGFCFSVQCVRMAALMHGIFPCCILMLQKKQRLFLFVLARQLLRLLCCPVWAVPLPSRTE